MSTVIAVAFLTIPVSQGSAEIIVNLDGSGTGTVTSNPTGEGGGIDCSNVGGGAPGPICGDSFAPFVPVELSATPGADSYFVNWTGDDPQLFGVGTCNSGDLNPCTVSIDYGPFGFPPVNITATFDQLPDPPGAVTGANSVGAHSFLRVLEGSVNPSEFAVAECYFEYGLTTTYGKTIPCVDPGASELGEGSEPIGVSAETEPLEPGTTYHYRLVASSIGGTAHGADRTFTTGPAPSDPCPNADRRAEQGIAALRLPDCMALEMVSPPKKAGQPAKFPNVSASGGRVSFSAQTALGEDTPTVLIGAPAYVAERTGSGWVSEAAVPDLDPPFVREWQTASQPSFTPDFSRWFAFGTVGEERMLGIGRAYQVGLGGVAALLSEPGAPLTSPGGAVSEHVLESVFQAASADHSHLYFLAGNRATYFASDPAPSLGSGEPGNVYLAALRADGGPATLRLLQRDRAGKVWGGLCGARLGGIAGVLSQVPPNGQRNGQRNQGAVSADGTHTFLSARAAQPVEGACDTTNKMRILERLETSEGPVISPLFGSECSRPQTEPCSSADGDDHYQGASLKQTKVYFTTTRQLASSDLDESGEGCSGELTAVFPSAACDLYLYDSDRPAGHRLVQVSAGEDVPGEHEAGAGAEVFNGATAISADGSRAYFVAAGVLTEKENPQGDTPQSGQPNLYTWDAGSEETRFVGTLAPALSFSDPGDAILDKGEQGLWGGGATWRNDAYPAPVSGVDAEGDQVGGDGHILVFGSRSELTPNDADGRHRDVFRYDAGAGPGTLECLSCAPGSSGSEPDEAPFDVESHSGTFPPGTDFGELRRWVSEDGEAVAFATAQPLLPGDVNGADDYYLWSEGVLARLPGRPLARQFTGFSAPVLSHDGSTVAFATSTPLLPRDGDTTGDVYVARAGGGYPFPEPEKICDPGVNCQEAEDSPLSPPAASVAPQPENVRSSPCMRPARRAQGLSKRAKRGRRNARRLARNGNRGRARALHRRASRQARAARRASKRAKRCRRQRANTNRRAGE